MNFSPIIKNELRNMSVENIVREEFIPQPVCAKLKNRINKFIIIISISEYFNAN